MAAQAAVSAIRKGCEMLNEGKAEIDKFKKQVEGGVANAKAIYKEVTGLWGWIKSLFGDKPKKIVAPAVVEQAVAQAAPKKTSRAEPEPELTYEEWKARAVHQICENLKVYFEAQRALKEHCRELEEISLTTDKVADSAIDRIEIEWQMTEMSKQVREAMVYTKEELGLQALYQNFLKMYEQILEEQEFARQVAAKKQRDAKWQRDLLRNHRIDRGVTAAAVLLLILWMWGVLLSLGWLVKTHDGSSQRSSSSALCSSSPCRSHYSFTSTP
jgi:hypothetical protein